jgi:hypothetical protein
MPLTFAPKLAELEALSDEELRRAYDEAAGNTDWLGASPRSICSVQPSRLASGLAVSPQATQPLATTTDATAKC